MSFYKIPESIAGDINTFEEQIKGYRAGDVSGVQFKGIRVGHGLYEQRKPNTHMMRIRCAAGAVTPAQLRRVAELSKQYGAPEFHVTTRQELQFHYVDLEDVSHLYRELVKAGLSSRGGGGNTIRNIMASWDSGIRADETFEVDSYATALTTRMIAEEDSWNMPRKFKIAFSNSDEDVIGATITCVGFIAKVQDGVEGFKVYCCGGMGAKPIMGKVLYDFVKTDRVYNIVKAMKLMFDKYGNRRRRTMARIKFLWDKLGEEKFRAVLDEELTALDADDSVKPLTLEPYQNIAAVREGYAPEAPLYAQGFETWKETNVTAQKQDGLHSVLIPLHLGDVRNEDGILLADLMENFGENSIRLSILQNIHLRNIPEAYLGNVYNVICQLDTLSRGPKLFGHMVTCTGAATCKLGLCLPRGVTPEIQDRLLNSELDLQALSDIKIHISGCPNTCGRHHVADLGFFGKAGRSGKDMYPAYNVLAGAKLAEGDFQFAKKVDEVPAKDLPEFVHDLFAMYLSKKSNYANFTAYIEDGGMEDIKTLTAKYNKTVPALANDDSYYYDWGDGEQFSLLKGQKAECAAGVFDMIDVDVRMIKDQRALVEAQDSSDEGRKESLYKIIYAASRMLLVTRGVEVRDDNHLFESFVNYFIEANYVDARFAGIVGLAKAGDLDGLLAKQAEVLDLATAMQELYKSMDDSLRFNVGNADGANGAEVKAEAPAKAAAQPIASAGAATALAVQAPDITKDFRGVACPMNFVKTKIALEPMQTGQLLEVFLDDGAPIQNVPRSIMNEGHEILKQEQDGSGHWAVLIKKV